MIVISPSLALVPVSVIDPDAPVIGWRNIVTPEIVAADTEAAGYPASNLANVSTVEQWRSTDDAGEQFITIDASGTFDYVAIARHNFGSGQVSVRVDADVDSVWTEVVPEFLPGSDAPLMMLFESGTYLGLRVRLFADGVAPRASVLYAGQVTRLQRRMYVGHTPLPYGRGARVTNARSESGDFLGRIVLTETLETAASLKNITPAWYRATLDPFIVASKEVPFFWGWRPSSYPDEVGYAWMTNDPKPSNQLANGMMSIDLQMAGVAL